MFSAPPQAARASDTLFENVAGWEPNGAAAADKLRRVYANLKAVGANADAERLLTLDRAAARRDYASLERMLAAEHPLDQLSEIAHAPARKLSGRRNALALAPLLFTWLFLGLATWHYHRLVQDKPAKSTQPFIMLWEQRFDGALVLTFTETAIVASATLLLLLVLTVRTHHAETTANRTVNRFRIQLDDAFAALAVAAETSGIRVPMSAEEWAAAAQRVLAETQRMLEAAVRDTRALAETNMALVAEGQAALTTLYTEGREAIQALQEQGQELVNGLARETLVTMVAVREENIQLIAGTADQAREVLQQAGAANRKLVEEQMTPLFEGFKESLRAYRDDHRTYQDSAARLAAGATELATAARRLGESVDTYATTGASIDRHLAHLDGSQSALVAGITENSRAMTTAASAMDRATETMSGSLRTDLETLAGNVVAASNRLAQVDGDLVTTGSALEVTTRALLATANSLDRVATDLAGVAAGLAEASGRGGWWGRWMRPVGR